MANPPKVKDPAEAALSAVEEALKLDFGGPEALAAAPSSDSAAAPDTDAPEKKQERKAANDEARNARRRGRSNRPPAANDDRRNIGSLIYALQRRPSSAPFWGAAALTLLWGGVGASLAMSSLGDKLSSLSSFSAIAQSPELILAAIAVIGPIIFFWVMAMMIYLYLEQLLRFQ